MGSRDFLVRTQVRRRWVVAAVTDLSLRLNEQTTTGLGAALASLIGLVVSVLVGHLLAGRATNPLAEALNRQRRFVADASRRLPHAPVPGRPARRDGPGGAAAAPRVRLVEDVGALLRDAKGMAELPQRPAAVAQLRTGEPPSGPGRHGGRGARHRVADQVRAEQADVTLTAHVRPTPADSTPGEANPPCSGRSERWWTTPSRTHRRAAPWPSDPASEGQVRVDVVDDGEGFDTAALPNLVRPFARGHDDPASVRSGSGSGQRRPGRPPRQPHGAE